MKIIQSSIEIEITKEDIIDQSDGYLRLKPDKFSGDIHNIQVGLDTYFSPAVLYIYDDDCMYVECEVELSKKEFLILG